MFPTPSTRGRRQQAPNPGRRGAALATQPAAAGPATYPFAGWRCICLAVLLLLTAQLSQAQAPNVTYQGPIEIKHGGTYTGNFKSLDSTVPCVKIRTAEPVVLENCILAGAGKLIVADSTDHQITVRHCRGYGLTPSQDSIPYGQFLAVANAKSLRIENNYLERTSGINIYQWSGNGTASNTVSIVRNSARNLDGRHRNGTESPVSFLNINDVHGLVGAEIAWNQIINDPGNSYVEDNINFYNAGGTASSPILVHDNYIFGSFSSQNIDTRDHTGSGIICDGDAATAALATQYILAENNVVVATTNAGMNIAAGHHNTYRYNRIVCSAKAWVNNAEINVRGAYAGTSVWLADSAQIGFFGNHSVTNNTIGYVDHNGYRHDVDADPNNSFHPDPAQQTALPNPITRQTEQNEWTLWQQRLTQNCVVVGPMQLYRAINVNGGNLSIDGRTWEAGSTAANVTTNGIPFANQSVPLTPATDAGRAQMIRACLYSNALSYQLGSVPNGTYSVYFYVWEDNLAQTYSVALNGQTVLTNYNSGAPGSWARLGPFAVPVTSGTITLTSTGGDMNLSGLEVWQANCAVANQAPTVSISAPATGIVGQAFTINATAADADGSVSKVEFFNGATKLGEDATAPYSLSYSPTAAGTLSLTAKATDNANASTTSGTAAVTVYARTFYRAINVNGSAYASIDGHSWEAGATAPNVSTNGTPLATQSVSLIPSVSNSSKAALIRSFVYSTALSYQLSSVPNGPYQVSFYVFEDNAAETFSVALNGQTVLSNYSSGPAGTWAKKGPYTTTVSAGTLTLSSTGGYINLSGVEVYQLSSGSGSRLAAPAAATWTAYPNTFDQELNVRLETPATETITLALYNLYGVEVQRLSTKVKAGSTTLHLPTQALRGGVYQLKILSGARQGQSLRVMK